jgi:osmotically-inducible protein OsmY
MAQTRGEDNERYSQFNEGRERGRRQDFDRDRDDDRDRYATRSMQGGGWGGDDDYRREERERDWRGGSGGAGGMGGGGMNTGGMNTGGMRGQGMGGGDRDRGGGLWGQEDREDRWEERYPRSQADYDMRGAFGRGNENRGNENRGNENRGWDSRSQGGYDRQDRGGGWNAGGNDREERQRDSWSSRGDQGSSSGMGSMGGSSGMGGMGGQSYYGGYGQESRQTQDAGRTGLRRNPEHIGKGPKGYTRTDERILEEIHERLSMGYLDASEIEVSVKGGEVTLKGTVTSKTERRNAEDAIEDVVGVKEVDNRLKVKAQSTSTSSSGQQAGQTGQTGQSSTQGSNESERQTSQHKRS